MFRQSQHTEKFQFHTGSIKSTSDKIDLMPWVGGFNSILVRLKAESVADLVRQSQGFNSILVRLKATYAKWYSRYAQNVSIPYWFD